MWTCVNCGEANLDTADSCEVCARPSGPPAPAPPIGTPPATPPQAHPGPFPVMWPARWVLAAAVAVLVLAGAIVMPRLHRTDRSTAADGVSAATETAQPDAREIDTQEVDTEETEAGQSDAGQTDAGQTDTGQSGGPGPGWTQGVAAGSAAPTGAGIVSVAAGVTDSRSLEVARMFDTYFSGINDKDYDAVGSVLDPAGPVDPGNAKQMAAFARGTRSTRDSEVTLTALADPGDGWLRAEVTFRSDQDPGDGPKGRTAETCTRWAIGYTLSSAGGTYRIRRGEATSQPC